MNNVKFVNTLYVFAMLQHEYNQTVSKIYFSLKSITTYVNSLFLKMQHLNKT